MRGVSRGALRRWDGGAGDAARLHFNFLRRSRGCSEDLRVGAVGREGDSARVPAGDSRHDDGRHHESGHDDRRHHDPGQTTPGTTTPGTTIAGTTVAGTTVAGSTIAGTTVPGTTVLTTQTVTVTGTSGSAPEALLPTRTTARTRLDLHRGRRKRQNGNITAAVSNGDLNITGNTSVDTGLYLNTNGPPARHCTSSGITNVAPISSPVSWPLTWTMAQVCGTTPTTPATTTDPPPGYYNKAITLNGSQTNGTYCSTVSIAFTGNNKSYNVTAVAPKITISGTTRPTTRISDRWAQTTAARRTGPTSSCG